MHTDRTASLHFSRATTFISCANANLIYLWRLCCWGQQQRFTARVWCTALFWSGTGGLCVYILYLTECYLGVAGTEKPTSKQNPCMCSLVFPPSIFTSPSLFSFSIATSPSHCVFHCLSFFLSLDSHRFLSFLPSFLPPSPTLPASNTAPAVPGKSWLWYPRKTSPSRERGRWKGSKSAHLLQSRYFCCFLLKQRADKMHFSKCQFIFNYCTPSIFTFLMGW